MLQDLVKPLIAQLDLATYMTTGVLWGVEKFYVLNPVSATPLCVSVSLRIRVPKLEIPVSAGKPTIQQGT